MIAFILNDKILDYIMFEDEDLNDIDIFVFCGGKCGGSTLHTTFKRNGFKSYHTHSNGCFKRDLKPNFNGTIFDVIDGSANKPIYIIDSYRTPIERKISSFFQNISIHLPDYKQCTVHKLIHFFNTNLLNPIEEYHSIDEVMNHYGLEPTTFDFEHKYTLIQKGNLNFVKLRFKDIDEWSSILSKIMNRPIVLHHDNLTRLKAIHPLYTTFKEQYRVPETYLYSLSNSIPFNLYNTEYEKNKYINDWKTKLITPRYIMQIRSNRR